MGRIHKLPTSGDTHHFIMIMMSGAIDGAITWRFA